MRGNSDSVTVSLQGLSKGNKWLNVTSTPCHLQDNVELERKYSSSVIKLIFRGRDVAFGSARLSEESRKSSAQYRNKIDFNKAIVYEMMSVERRILCSRLTHTCKLNVFVDLSLGCLLISWRCNVFGRKTLCSELWIHIVCTTRISGYEETDEGWSCFRDAKCMPLIATKSRRYHETLGTSRNTSNTTVAVAGSVKSNSLSNPGANFLICRSC